MAVPGVDSAHAPSEGVAQFAGGQDEKGILGECVQGDS